VEQNTLPTSLFEAYQRDKQFHQRMTFGLAGGGEELDASLRKFSGQVGVNYLSHARFYATSGAALP
jgi:hypothetical protein